MPPAACSSGSECVRVLRSGACMGVFFVSLLFLSFCCVVQYFLAVSPWHTNRLHLALARAVPFSHQLAIVDAADDDDEVDRIVT